MKKKLKDNLQNNPYLVLTITFVYLLVFAFFVDSPTNIFNGLLAIFKQPGILISDYIEIGGIGAALFNAGLAGLYVLAICKLSDVRLNGSLIMTAWIVCGFALFGKNVANMTPIVLGGFLYAKSKKESFQKYLLVTLLTTTLAPTVFQVNAVMQDYSNLGLFIGVCVGISVGFITPAISANAMKSSGGYNLYNVGFSAGLLGIAIMGVYRGIGFDFPLANFWNVTNSTPMAILVATISLLYIFLGFYLGENNKKNINKIFKSSGKLLSDYYLSYGDSTYINAGLLGLIGLFVLYLIEAPINGPTTGAIFTLIAFSFLGKHPFNATPVMLGALLGGIFSNLLGVHSLQSPGIILGILFCTGLSPITGTFGFRSGVLAGFIHIFVVTNITSAHGGLNLYNNGLAAGLVAMILVPLIISFRRGDYN